MLSNYNIKELIVFLPEIILFCSSILILISAVLFKKCQKLDFIICISSILAAIFALFYLDLGNYGIDELVSNVSISELGYIANTEKNNLKILTLFLSLLIVLSFLGNYLIQKGYEENSKSGIDGRIKVNAGENIFGNAEENSKDNPIKKFKSEYLALITFSCLGIFSSISAENFLSLFVSLELCSFVAYILCAIDRKNTLASEASVKYFVMGAVMSCISLFGISLLYGINKAGISVLDFNENLASDWYNIKANGFDASYILPIVFILSNLMFKLGLFPFHSPLIDVYQGCPSYVVNFFGSINKIPAIAAIIFIKSIVKIPLAENLCVILSIISMLFASFGGIKQKSIKRILGYSSMLNFGFIAYYLISIDLSHKISLNYLYLYILVYSTSVIGVFSILCVFSNNDLSKVSEDVNVSDLSGVYKTYPLLTTAFVIFMFSIMGMPPLSGFFVKYNAIKLAVTNNIYFAFAALFSSVIAGYYYLSIIKTVIFDEVLVSSKNNIKIKSAENCKKINIWPIYLSCSFCLFVNTFLVVFLWLF